MSVWDDYNKSAQQMAAQGYTQSWDAYQAALPKEQPKQEAKKKNFFLDQISTVGGILGGIGGSFLSPLAGTAVGAGAGSALGEAIENIIMGEDVGKNVIKEGALGAVFGAGPLKLAKGAIAGGTQLAKGAGTAAAKEAASKAAMTPIKQLAFGAADPMATKVMKLSSAGKLNTLGNKALASQYGTISKPTANSTDPINTIAKLADYGITKPVDAEMISSRITGSGGILNRAVVSSLSGGPAVKVSGIKKILKDTIAENGLVDSDAKSIKKVVDAQLRAMAQSGNSPEAVLKSVKNLERRIANLTGRGGNYRMVTPERQDQAGALGAVKDWLEDRLYGSAGSGVDMSKVLTPKVRDELLSLSPNNQKWRDFIDNGVMKSASVKELRSAQAPFVRISKIISDGDTNQLTFAGRMSNGQMNGGTISNTLLNATTQVVKNPLLRKVAGPLRDAGKPSVTTRLSKQTPIGIAKRIGAVGAIDGVMGQQSPEASLEDALVNYSSGPNAEYQAYPMNPMINNTTTPVNTNSNMNSPYTNNSYMSSTPYPRENLLYDLQRDPENAENYIKTYQMIQEIFSPEAEEVEPLTQGQQERADLQKALGMAEDAMAAGSINYGPIGSTVEGIKAVFNAADPETLAYKNIISGLRAAITKARAGASLTEGELRMLEKYTPSDTDSEQVVRSKLQQLRALYGYESPSGGTTLEDMILQAQSSY